MSVPTKAARYVVIACAGAYGAMKLWWLLGGDLLKAQTPLPQDAQQNLLAGSPLTTASHGITALLAAAAVLVAWSLGTGRAGRRVERLLRIGAVLVGVLMIVRAVGGLGFGFVGDALVLAGVISVGDPRYADHVARWDLFLWAPYWLLFGVAWVSLAVATRSRHDDARHSGTVGPPRGGAGDAAAL
ncbi:MAG TPA: DUF3995 domain-containing protein [Nocardioidaceae bacterium]|nr:DUF3995 domain-containing protein [Nocardioidaceae bacterium]